ncbi:FMN-dependent NADH-azoreductase, partial [bacterium]
MKNILVLNSSLSGPASVTERLLEEAVAQLRARYPEVTVVHRDLARDPIPHLTPETVAGVRAVASTPVEEEARQLSDTLIAELMAADVVVIGVP